MQECNWCFKERKKVPWWLVHRVGLGSAGEWMHESVAVHSCARMQCRAVHVFVACAHLQPAWFELEPCWDNGSCLPQYLQRGGDYGPQLANAVLKTCRRHSACSYQARALGNLAGYSIALPTYLSTMGSALHRGHANGACMPKG